MNLPRASWALALAFIAVGALVLSGGCPKPPNDDGSGNGGTDNGGGGGGDDNGGSGGGGSGGGSGGGGAGGGGSGGGSSGGGSGGGGSGGGGSSGGGSSGGGSSGGGSGGGGSGGGGSGGSTQPPPAPTKIILTPIAQTGDNVPQQVAGVTFRDFGLPIIDAKGRIAFWARYQGTGAKGAAGLYVWNGTELELIVHDDPATAGTVPGRTSADYFGKRQGFDPRAYELAWGAGDRLIFVSDVTNGSNDSSGVYRWRASDGNLARVADAEQIAGTFPDVSQGQSGPVFGANFYGVPGVSDTGIAIFGVNYTYIKATGEGFERFVIEKNGIFTSNGTSVTKVADDSTLTKGVVPDQANDAYFIEVVVNTTINGLGDMLFQARYTTSSGNGRGAYLRRGSNNYRAIDSRAGASWPGLPSGAQIGKKQYRLALGPAGHIAIDTTINLGSGEQDTVLLWDPQTVKWTQLTGPNGVAASALLSGVNDDGQVVILAADGDPYLVSGSGRTQLNATLPAQLQGANLTWNDSGGSINNHGRVVLRFTHDGKPGLVMWTGARLLLVADAAADVPDGISDLSTVVGPERDRPGRSGMFNDRDELVFRVKYDDGSEALYLASGEP